MAHDISTQQPARNAATCEWASATLWLAAPFWFEAERAPWSCLRDDVPRVLDTTDICTACPRWERRVGRLRPGLAIARAAGANPPWLDWVAGCPAPHETG